jgi:hypothetical protein
MLSPLVGISPNAYVVAPADEAVFSRHAGKPAGTAPVEPTAISGKMFTNEMAAPRLTLYKHPLNPGRHQFGAEAMNALLSPRASRALATLLVSAALSCVTTASQASVKISTRPTKHMSCSGAVCTPKKPNAVLNVADLANMLAAGDVKVVSDASALDIVIAAPLTWTSTSRLVLSAYNSIVVEQPVSVAGQGALTLSPAQGGQNGVIEYRNKGHFTFWDLGSNLVISGATYSLVNSVSMLVAAVAANPSSNYALANNYEASTDGTYKQAPIGIGFHGMADGLGNATAHLRIDDETANHDVGLFAYTDGWISHLTLAQARVKGGFQTHVGALVGRSYGHLHAISVSGLVASGDYGYVGGIVGDDEGGFVDSSRSTAAVNGGHAARAGGIAGELYSAYNCVASGPVAIMDGIAGGLVGAGSYAISKSESSASVTATVGHSAVGGLAGTAYGIDDSDATGHVSAVDDSLAGGLAGLSLGVNRSYATGAVTVTGRNGIAGGLLGRVDGIVWNSYATGTVDTGRGGEAGSLAGLYAGNGQLNNSFATGNVKGGKYRGGVAGFADNGTADMTSVYWDVDTSGISDPRQGVGNIKNFPGSTGLTTAQFKSSLPDGFDPKTWAEQAGINNGYPYLLANPPPK